MTLFTIPAGATITNNGTQTGFGRTGTVDWQTGSIKTATFTAVNGEGYFVTLQVELLHLHYLPLQAQEIL